MQEELCALAEESKLTVPQVAELWEKAKKKARRSNVDGSPKFYAESKKLLAELVAAAAPKEEPKPSLLSAKKDKKKSDE